MLMWFMYMTSAHALEYSGSIFIFWLLICCLLSSPYYDQMDLETENRIAAILIKEAAELRKQAEKEGVDAYLRQPKFRGRPNSRFLTATVLGVQQG